MTECERIVNKRIIEEAFLADEYRSDYHVSTKMKKVWAVELDLINEFDKICKAYNLRYWVGFGTLLGAVRHHGFIPWDDDVDVWMPRDDYDRLLSLNIKLDEPYFLQTTLNDNDYYKPFANLRNSNTAVLSASKNNKCNNGICIDIFPIDGLEKNEIVRWMRLKYIRARNIVAHAYMYNIYPNPIGRLIHWFLRLKFIPYDYKKNYVHTNKIASKIKWNDTDKVGFVVYPPYANKHNVLDKTDFEDTEYMIFESLSVPVPSKYDNLLRIMYGDYMLFPPIEKRGLWHNWEFEPDISYKDILEY